MCVCVCDNTGNVKLRFNMFAPRRQWYDKLVLILDIDISISPRVINDTRYRRRGRRYQLCGNVQRNVSFFLSIEIITRPI